MTPQEFQRYVHPREMPRFILALVFVIPLMLGIFAFAFFTNLLIVAYALVIAFVVWFGFEIAYALLLGNWILVSPHNYPRLHALLEEVKQTIGVREHVDMIVYQQGEFNAYFAMLFARRAIFINSELLADGVTDDELRWIIGRFVGRIRSKRRMGVLRYAVALAERLILFNLFLYPYERATAYTGDRVGLGAIKGDISAAVSAMNKLMVGREIGYSVNPAGVARQYRRVKGSLFGFLARIGTPLPHMLARYVDLIGFAERAFPEQSEAFVAMNPSFQTAGGAWELVRATQKEGDGRSNAMGWGLLGGAIVTAMLGGVTLATTGPGFGVMGGGGMGLPNPFDRGSDPYAYEQPISDPFSDVLDDAGAGLMGSWDFVTDPFPCGLSGSCQIQGRMEIVGAPGDLSCRFTAYQIGPMQGSAEQSCRLYELGDGRIEIQSTVEYSETESYEPDNFLLRQDGPDRLVGELQSVEALPVTFTRAY